MEYFQTMSKSWLAQKIYDLRDQVKQLQEELLAERSKNQDLEQQIKVYQEQVTVVKKEPETGKLAYCGIQVKKEEPHDSANTSVSEKVKKELHVKREQENNNEYLEHMDDEIIVIPSPHN